MTLMQGGFGMQICQDFHLKEAMDILLLILLSACVLFVFYRITDRMTIWFLDGILVLNIMYQIVRNPAWAIRTFNNSNERFRAFNNDDEGPPRRRSAMHS
jgi:hypothetical protein